MAVEKILTHKNGVVEYIITSKEDLNGLVDVEVGSRAKLLSPVEVKDYIYCGKWAEVKREDSYGDNEIEGIIDDINDEIMDNAVEIVNEYHKNLYRLVDINVTPNSANISKDVNQYFNIENDKNFVLPNMDGVENNSIKELNLYIDVKGEYTLTFPSDIKWVSNVVNLNKEDYISISLKYIKVNDVGLWLGNIKGIK